MAQRNHRLIDGKIAKYMLPSIMMNMAMQLGNIVDTMLVGNLLGTKAMSAIMLCMPVALLEQVVGFGLGTGAAIAAATFLGKRDKKSASDIFSTVFWLTVIFGALFVLAAFFLCDPVAHLLSGGGEFEGLARDYMFIWMLGCPVIGIGLYLMNFMGVESQPRLSSAYIIVSNVINLVLDYIFLAYTPLGIKGAALSTVIGYLGGMAVYIKYIRMKGKMLSLRPVIALSSAAAALKSGFPTLIYMGMKLVQSLGLNFIIKGLLGEEGFTIYTVCSNVMMIMLMVTGGIIGVIPNLAGVLYGEKDYYGLRSVALRTLKTAGIVTAGLLIGIMIFAGQVAGLFGVNEESLLGFTVPAMRCFMLCLPFFVWNKFLTSYYQCIGETRFASLITLLENGTIILPAAYISISLALSADSSGFIAMGLSFVISEGLTAAVSLVIGFIKHPKSPVFILPGTNTGECLDLSIPADKEEVPALVRRMLEFAVENGVERTLANRMTVAAEEMTENIIAYGGKSSEWIDLCLTIEPEVLRMRIRDNGIPFDPTSYEFDGDLFDISGIGIVKRLASDINYVRSIDLNNTVIEVGRNVITEEH